MSYDYSSESKGLELPNPYKLQNRVLLFCALVLAGAGLLALWWARGGLQAAEGSKAGVLVNACVGLALLAAAIWAGATALRRLRFFFGRGRPQSLAAELPPQTEGSTPAAQGLKELLRQGALSYAEPQGAVEGLLYHWAPRLITAPAVVQAEARHHSFNSAALALTLLSFVLAWGVLGNEASKPWISIGYFAFGLFFLLRPLVQDAKARLSVTALLALVAGAVLAPVAIALVADKLPALGSFSLAAQTAVMLSASLLASLISLAAALAQVEPPGSTQTSAVQRRLSMPAPPALLLDELDRLLQAQWTERIPNRRYARQVPVIDPARHTGPFTGDLFDETQPMPRAGATALDFGSALASRRHRMLVALDVYAAVLVVIAAGIALRFVHGFDMGTAWAENRWGTAGMAGLLLLVAGFCLRGAAGLWGRFDFSSELVWLSMEGTYQTSRIGTGNQFTSKLNTQSELQRTESMTLRIWRARIDSVVFGKDASRQVTAMFSTEREAQALADHLEQFARSQAVLVAPTSSEDAARAQQLHAAEQLMGGAVDLDLALPFAAAGSSAAPAPATRHCHHCGASLAAAARFCSACGTAVP